MVVSTLNLHYITPRYDVPAHRHPRPHLHSIMTLGYKFNFSIYSLIHAVLEILVLRRICHIRRHFISLLSIPFAYLPFHSIYSYCSFTNLPQ
jgi:hypothetical protein